jgi:hypothetical protein
MTQLFPVYTNPLVNFRQALGAAAATFTPPFVGTVIEDLPGVPPGRSGWFLIRAISYLAVENIGLEFDFWATALGMSGVVTTETFLSRYQFASANGAQFAGLGPFHYYVDGLAIPYIDQDHVGSTAPRTLHVSVQNIDTVAKSANNAGMFKATFWLEPMDAIQG